MMVRRAGARPGDGIWVTGTIGDGALGLAVAQGRLADPSGFLLDRYRLPRPRLALAVSGIASAGMDVSDGLAQDLGHLCRAAGLSADIEARDVPLSEAARAAGPDWLAACLTGGDDYELLLAVPPDRTDALCARPRARAACRSRASARSGRAAGRVRDAGRPRPGARDGAAGAISEPFTVRRTARPRSAPRRRRCRRARRGRPPPLRPG